MIVVPASPAHLVALGVPIDMVARQCGGRLCVAVMDRGVPVATAGLFDDEKPFMLAWFAVAKGLTGGQKLAALRALLRIWRSWPASGAIVLALRGPEAVAFEGLASLFDFRVYGDTAWAIR